MIRRASARACSGFWLELLLVAVDRVVVAGARGGVDDRGCHAPRGGSQPRWHVDSWLPPSPRIGRHQHRSVLVGDHPYGCEFELAADPRLGNGKKGAHPAMESAPRAPLNHAPTPASTAEGALDFREDDPVDVARAGVLTEAGEGAVVDEHGAAAGGNVPVLGQRKRLQPVDHVSSSGSSMNNRT